MYLVYFVFLFSSIYMYFKFFKKKIMVLLFLELAMVSSICLYLNFSFFGSLVSSFFSSMIFFTFMVIDSVFGLSLLIFSSRNSSFYSNFFFFY